MQKTFIMPDYDLQLFNGAAAGAPAGGDSAGASGQEGAGTLPKADNRGSSRRRSGEYDNVVFGKQEDAPAAGTADPAAGGSEGSTKSGVETTSDTLEAKRKAFQDLIEGEYKDQYTETFQKAFNRRFRETKSMEDSLAAQKPIMDILMQRYKIADGDMAKLQSAIEEDSSYWEKAAEEAGLTVEQFKSVQKLERENAELKAFRQRHLGEQQAQAQMSKWMREAEGVKEIYPGFDFRAELGNKDFKGLLQAGIPVQKAFELIHMDEIREATARSAAQTASQQMQAKMRSRAARPSENGTSSQCAVVVKSDVHSLSRADRAEAVRRAQRGEKIAF